MLPNLIVNDYKLHVAANKVVTFCPIFISVPSLLTKEIIILNIIITKQCFQVWDIINGVQITQTMFE
jgi:hypothetical protein